MTQMDHRRIDAGAKYSPAIDSFDERVGAERQIWDWAKRTASYTSPYSFVDRVAPATEGRVSDLTTLRCVQARELWATGMDRHSRVERCVLSALIKIHFTGERFEGRGDVLILRDRDAIVG